MCGPRRKFNLHLANVHITPTASGKLKCQQGSFKFDMLVGILLSLRNAHVARVGIFSVQEIVVPFN